MRVKVTRMIPGIAPAVLLILWLVQPALAVHLPTHGDVVLLDLNQPGFVDVIPGFPLLPELPLPAVGGPSGVFKTGEFVNFWDSVPRVFNPWHWETEIANPGPTPMTFRILLYTDSGCAVSGLLALPPGWGFYCGIAVPDYPPEQGWSTWGAAWNGKSPVAVDTSVTENLGRDTAQTCSFEWKFVAPDPEPPRPYDCWPYYPTFKRDIGVTIPTNPFPWPSGPYPLLVLRIADGYHRLPTFARFFQDPT